MVWFAPGMAAGTSASAVPATNACGTFAWFTEQISTSISIPAGLRIRKIELLVSWLVHSVWNAWATRSTSEPIWMEVTVPRQEAPAQHHVEANATDRVASGSCPALRQGMDEFDFTAMRRRVAHILEHAQQVRAWAMQATELQPAERAAVLHQLAGLERTAQTLLTASNAMERRLRITEET